MLVRAPTLPLRTRPRVQRAPGIPCALPFSRVNPIKTRAHGAARPRSDVFLRSAKDEAVVLAISDRFLARIEQEAAAIGVQISIAVDERRAAPMLDAAGADLVRSVAGDLGMKVLTLKTVTGHDALAIQKKIPSSLIFVPSKDGLSHNPREYTAPEALRQLLAAHRECTLTRQCVYNNALIACWRDDPIGVGSHKSHKAFAMHRYPGQFK